MSDSKTPGHIALNGLEYVLQEETYQQQLQTPFNPRFSTGEQSFGDLSFFQYLAQEDWSGGNGQLTFDVSNQFMESEGMDVNTPGELKLAPKVEFVTNINGPQKEQFNRPVEQEDAWPQIIEWLGRAIVFNDRVEADAGGVDFLEVFETDVQQDKVINKDPSGTSGSITNDTRAEILSISRTSGLPGDLINVSVRFKRIQLEMMSAEAAKIFPNCPKGTPTFTEDVRFRLDFGGESEQKSETYAYQDIPYSRQTGQFEFQAGAGPGGSDQAITLPGSFPYTYLFLLNRDVIVDFTIRVPNKAPGIYKLWTSCGWRGAPFTKRNIVGDEISRTNTTPFPDIQDLDPLTNANVLFYIESVDTVTVDRKNLYTPQLKAACVSGSRLVGMRTLDALGYIEVYAAQNAGVDRVLQLKLSDVSATISNPTYCELLASSNGVVVAAFDNRVYKIDVDTSGLTTAQRFTFIGVVPGTYVSGMALWNQRVYGGSFDKSKFRSTIWWTDLTAIQGSYDIDGKFWITDMANFQGALFYSGGTLEGKGEIRAFPSKSVVSVEHPIFESRCRSLNAGRLLYGGWSHGSGLLAINDVPGASTWARIDLGDSQNNVVWDIEEVGQNVYFLLGNALYKTTGNFIGYGWLESSELGSNTPLIRKLFNTITVEVKRLAGNQKIRVLATHSLMEEGQWIILGEITNADGVQKDFTLPNDFQAPWMKYRLEVFTDDQATSPVIKRVLVKYVPTVLQKWQWVFGIRATDSLILLDKKEEGRSGSKIIADLQDLKSFGLIKFRDVDETIYSAILTDLKISPPLVDKENRESIIFVELLEI